MLTRLPPARAQQAARKRALWLAVRDFRQTDGAHLRALALELLIGSNGASSHEEQKKIGPPESGLPLVEISQTPAASSAALVLDSSRRGPLPRSGRDLVPHSSSFGAGLQDRSVTRYMGRGARMADGGVWGAAVDEEEKLRKGLRPSPPVQAAAPGGGQAEADTPVASASLLELGALLGMSLQRFIPPPSASTFNEQKAGQRPRGIAQNEHSESMSPTRSRKPDHVWRDNGQLRSSFDAREDASVTRGTALAAGGARSGEPSSPRRPRGSSMRGGALHDSGHEEAGRSDFDRRPRHQSKRGGDLVTSGDAAGAAHLRKGRPDRRDRSRPAARTLSAEAGGEDDGRLVCTKQDAALERAMLRLSGGAGLVGMRQDAETRYLNYYLVSVVVTVFFM